MKERKTCAGRDDSVGHVHAPISAGKQKRSSLNRKMSPLSSHFSFVTRVCGRTVDAQSVPPGVTAQCDTDWFRLH